MTHSPNEELTTSFSSRVDRFYYNCNLLTFEQRITYNHHFQITDHFSLGKGYCFSFFEVRRGGVGGGLDNSQGVKFFPHLWVVQ